ncbi:ankyrin repeat domain-containing protein [Catenuloplanes indicus]|uniref:Ankyrin repeat protein n=1 Tax=Catenuloplanes indicus TaxID=137267 RepID=A0AAE3VX44_9ACTN|nr:ankyrin repeat domain-containing protein [Catenuloplanes indicus]MDQ0365285.1 ankyrin repeat protein [Catenuloplanes indicus]
MSLPYPFVQLLPVWREARRFAVPAGMVTAATARREAGDVAGACAAAAVDLRADLAAVHRTRGAEVAARLAADLRHLAPDLTRWHAPRERGQDRGVLAPRRAITLARYGPDALYLRTPATAHAVQRMSLHFGPLDHDDPWVRTDSWAGARHLWDVRAAPGLRAVLGGDRLPFFDGMRRIGRPAAAPAPPDDRAALAEWTIRLLDDDAEIEAWAAAGIALHPPRHRLPWTARQVFLPLLRDTLDRMAAGPDDAVLLWPSEREGRVIVSRGPAGLSARIAPTADTPDVPVLPVALWRRSPDLELLRLGLIRPAGLHPLVRAALFPDAPDDYRPGPVADAERIRVRCGTVWHPAGWRDGRLELSAHGPDEARRERAMRALGAPVPRCFTIEDGWRHGPAGRLPKRLRVLRRHLLLTAAHGDPDGVTRLLDHGVDPAVTGIDGGNLLHLAGHLNRPELITRLIAAGLSVHDRDRHGRTPLAATLLQGAAAPVVRALLDAGARTDVTALDRATPLHLLHSPDATTILPWLLATGLDLEARDHAGRTPLFRLIHHHAPPEPIAALLAAGADPHAGDTLETAITTSHRTDLDFLRTRPTPEATS